MNIGIVTTWFERGAAYVSRQYRDILSSENSVFIFARGGESYAVGDPVWDSKSVTWSRKTKNPIPTSFDIDEFSNWIKDNKLDIVFFNEQNWWTPVIACRRLGVMCGTYVDYYTENTVPYFAAYDFLICNTKRHYEVFKWHPQCLYIPWGTDTNLFKLSNEKTVAENIITFFHSAGVSPNRKGCDLVINAFSKIEEPARLVIHSQQDLKKYYPDLRNLISRLEDEGKLVLFEKTVSAPGLFHLGDVYVYPTRLEGIGLTILEANACGLPVITTKCEPMTEFIIEGVNGRHAAVKNYISRADGYFWPQAIVCTDDLTNQMRWYIENIKDIRELKIAAREYTLKHYSWKENAKDLCKIFSSLYKNNELFNQGILKEIEIYEFHRKNLHMPNHYQVFRSDISNNFPKTFKAITRFLDRLRN